MGHYFSIVNFLAGDYLISKCINGCTPGLLVLISGISNTTMKCHGNSARNLDSNGIPWADSWGILMGFFGAENGGLTDWSFFHDMDYPLVNIQKAIENGHWNSWFTLCFNGDFPSFFLCLPGRVGLLRKNLPCSCQHHPDWAWLTSRSTNGLGHGGRW